MILTDNDIKVTAAVIAPLITAVCSFLLIRWIIRWNVRRFKQGKASKTDDNKLMYLYAAIILVLYYACMAVVQTGFIALIEILIIACGSYYQSRYCKGEYERAADRCCIAQEERMKMFKMGYGVLLCWNLSILMIFMIGVRFGLQWVLPEVTIVRWDEGRYSSKTDYELFNGKDLRLTDCYVDNCTPDTLYRMIVWYAIPSEGDDSNVFTVTDTIAPETMSKVRGKVCYAMKRIPSFRDYVVTRTGRIHRKVTYVVDKTGYLRFKYSSSPARYGLKSNRQVESSSFTERNIMK